jgi:hypothetical protein
MTLSADNTPEKTPPKKTFPLGFVLGGVAFILGSLGFLWVPYVLPGAKEYEGVGQKVILLENALQEANPQALREEVDYLKEQLQQTLKMVADLSSPAHRLQNKELLENYYELIKLRLKLIQGTPYVKEWQDLSPSLRSLGPLLEDLKQAGIPSLPFLKDSFVSLAQGMETQTQEATSFLDKFKQTLRSLVRVNPVHPHAAPTFSNPDLGKVYQHIIEGNIADCIPLMENMPHAKKTFEAWLVHANSYLQTEKEFMAIENRLRQGEDK